MRPWSDIHGEYFTILQTIRRNRNFDENDPRRTILQVSTPKTKAGRRAIPLTPKLKEILDVQWKHQQELKEKAGDRWQNLDLVFTTEVGTPFEGRNMTRTLHRILRQEGIERFGVHSLRHPYVKLKTRLILPNCGIEIHNSEFYHIPSILLKQHYFFLLY